MSTVGLGSGVASASNGPLALAYDGFEVNGGRFGGAVFVGNSLANAAATIDHTALIENSAGSVGAGCTPAATRWP